MPLDSDMSVEQLIDVVEHVSTRDDAYLELYLNGIVFRIYPSRIAASDEKERLKTFASFVRTLSRVVKMGETQFALRALTNLTVFESEFTDYMEIGIVHSGGMIWMPCEIDRVQLPIGPPSFSVPTFEEEDNEPVMRGPLRKILL